MKNGDEADTVAPDFKRAIEAADNYDVALSVWRTSLY